MVDATLVTRSGPRQPPDRPGRFVVGAQPPDNRTARQNRSTGHTHKQIRRCGVSVAKSALVPPGPIPNPVVTRRSAGEYYGGDFMGGEAAAGTPHRHT